MVAYRDSVAAIDPISAGQAVDITAPGGIQSGLVRYSDEDIVVVELLTT